MKHPVRWIAAVVAAFAVAVTFVLAGNLGADPNAKPAIVGRTAPSFDAPRLDRGRLRSADFAGQTYIVNFWASWCVPCRAEAPVLEDFAQRWRGRITLIGIVFNDSPSLAKQFRDEFGLTYPQITDPGSRLAIEYGVTGVPETFVVGPDGKVQAGLIGAVKRGILDEVLARVAAGQQVTRRNRDWRQSPSGN